MRIMSFWPCGSRASQRPRPRIKKKKRRKTGDMALAEETLLTVHPRARVCLRINIHMYQYVCQCTVPTFQRRPTHEKHQPARALTQSARLCTCDSIFTTGTTRSPNTYITARMRCRQPFIHHSMHNTHLQISHTTHSMPHIFHMYGIICSRYLSGARCKSHVCLVSNPPCGTRRDKTGKYRAAVRTVRTRSIEKTNGRVCLCVCGSCAHCALEPR